MENVMATLYKNKGIWYVSICHNYKRITRSLNTKDKRAANKLKANTVTQLLSEVRDGHLNYSNLNFNQLISKFLTTDHNWSKSTYKTYKYILTDHIKGKPLPSNPTSRAIYVRHINACWNWGL